MSESKDLYLLVADKATRDGQPVKALMMSNLAWLADNDAPRLSELQAGVLAKSERQ